MAALRGIASIQTGATLRDRPKANPQGPVRLMQLGDVGPQGEISLSDLPFVEREPGFDRCILASGDLVFRGRGAGIAAAVVPPHEGEIVVALPLIIIRPEQQVVDPGYLAWVIGSPLSQRHFAMHMRGTGIVGVGKRDLETLEIDLPDLETQRKIAALVSLQRREAQLIDLHQDLRRQLLDSLLTTMVARATANPQRKGPRT